MRIGYSCWGFLGSGVVDTPDGSRAYRRPLLEGLLARGHDVVLLQADRDLLETGLDLRDRFGFDDGLPTVDVLVLEWRWPLPGRNTTACGSPGHTCDLHRQAELVGHYTRASGTPTVVWDLDRQLPAGDPLRRLPNVVVCEFATRPSPGAVTLLCPVPDDALDAADPVELARLPRSVPLVYVGNQYDRDDAFDRYFAPAAKDVPHRVAGKWPGMGRWPHVRFTGRCPFGDVDGIHREALSTVLLLPDRYARVGHMTSRLFEALLSGCLPLLPAEFVDGERLVPPQLRVATGAEVIERVDSLRRVAGTGPHADLIAASVRLLEPMRLSRQLNVLERLFATLTSRR